MVRVGIIGCGKIAQVRHIPEYEANPNAQVVALYDVDHDRAASSPSTTGRLHTTRSMICSMTPTSMR